MPLLKTLLRQLKLLFSLWLLWMTVATAQNATYSLGFPFTIHLGNATIATFSSSTGGRGEVFLGKEPAVFTLENGVLSSGEYVLGTGALDKSLRPKPVYWIRRHSKVWPDWDQLLTPTSLSSLLVAHKSPHLFGGRRSGLNLARLTMAWDTSRPVYHLLI
jgi:hypothetical protein